MAERLHTVKVDLQPGHVSEYETGKREPSLLVLLQYSRTAGVSMEELVDDALDLSSSLPRKSQAAMRRRKIKDGR